MADAGWAHGSLIEPAIEDEPAVPGPEAGHLLDEAEDIVNSVGASVAAEIERGAGAPGGDRRQPVVAPLAPRALSPGSAVTAPGGACGPSPAALLALLAHAGATGP